MVMSCCSNSTWDGYRDRYGNIARLDRVLEAEGDSPNRCKVSKQADVLMLLYLLSPHELRGLLAGLGYEVSEEQQDRTVDYYLPRLHAQLRDDRMDPGEERPGKGLAIPAAGTAE